MAGVLIERAAFLASLEGLLGEALDGGGRLVFLGGEAGVGKTTLAVVLADAAGVPVRRGSCDNVTTAEALGPILDALPELIAAVDDEAGVSRLRLFRNVRGALSGSPMLLLLEDVHWADEVTLDILRYLGRRLAGLRLMIMATFRSEEVSRDHPLTVVMGDLAGLSGVVRMQLPPLTATGVRQLLDTAGSALDADAIFQRTGGNPFYLTEVLAAGAEQVPATVRDAVLARVARLGAHREAAEQFRLALQHHEPPDRQRAGLLERLSYESYLTDRLVRARDSLLEALAIYEREGDARSVGTSQRWLSRLSWVLGQNADSERYAAAAVSTLEPLEPGPELAMAYSNMGQLRMLSDDNAAALDWGTKAIGLARELGDTETEIHALNNVGTALATAGDLIEGQARLTQSLDLALARDAHEHAARAFTNLGSTNVINWSLADADRHLHAGITYCADRDLDTWRLYMTAWLARSLAEQGRYDAAERHVADVTRRPHVSPITQELDEALTIAVRTGEALRLIPVAAACAEAAWIAGRPQDLIAAIDRAWPVAVAHPHTWGLGELGWWLRLAGDGGPAIAPLARPFALMLADEHRAAQRRGRPWAARCGRPTRWPSRRRCGTRSSAWTSWTSWAPRPCATPCCATGTPAAWRYRAAHARRAVPTRPGSPPARPRCSSFSRTACPTPRSPSGSSCPRRPWATTSRPCSASWGSRPGPGRSPRRCASGSSRQDREHAPCASRSVSGFLGRQATSLLRNPREDITMALFMDAHTMGGPVTLDDVAKAHAADLQTQDAHGVHYLRYWVDQEHGKIFCLVDAPDADAAATVHREAHGLVADEIYPVAEGA